MDTNNTFPYYWGETLSSYRSKRRSSGLIGLLSYVVQSVYCLLYCTALSNSIELSTVTVKRKAEREAMIAGTELI
jgi:hypothetical protein